VTTWEALLDVFPSLAELQGASTSDIAQIDGFADKSAAQIVQGLKAKASEIKALLKVGVTPKPWKSRAASGGVLGGKTIAITGALSRPRAAIEEMIKAAGGKPASSVSAKTFALVSNEGDSQSSKMKKAKELGIPVWSEAELLKKLGLDDKAF
jgi:DNA ligase (NAD+)